MRSTLGWDERKQLGLYAYPLEEFQCAWMQVTNQGLCYQVYHHVPPWWCHQFKRKKA